MGVFLHKDPYGLVRQRQQTNTKSFIIEGGRCATRGRRRRRERARWWNDSIQFQRDAPFLSLPLRWFDSFCLVVLKSATLSRRLPNHPNESRGNGTAYRGTKLTAWYELFLFFFQRFLNWSAKKGEKQNKNKTNRRDRAVHCNISCQFPSSFL